MLGKTAKDALSDHYFQTVEWYISTPFFASEYASFIADTAEGMS